MALARKSGSSPGQPGQASVRDRVKELRRVRASELAPNPKNWRRHPVAQRRVLRALIRELGYADALLAREEVDGTLVLLDGHLRRELHPDQVVPVLVLDLTEEEGDKLLALLDPIAALARPDPAALAELLGGVESASAAVRAFLQDIARGAGLPQVAGYTDPDDVPEPLPAAVSRPGDVWILGEHRLVCGDATAERDVQVAVGGARADLLWTDPPYGVDYRGKTARALSIEGDRPEELEALLRGAFARADAVLRPGAALYVAHPAGALAHVFWSVFLDQGWRIRQTLVWAKDRATLGHTDYRYRHEPVLYGLKPGPGRWGRGHRGWYGGNDQDSVFEIPRPKASPEHPTVKPVELVARCLRNSSRPGDMVLDPFAGSGSTLIACESLRRRFVGLDIDPRYVDVAVTRWERFTGRRAERCGW